MNTENKELLFNLFFVGLGVGGGGVILVFAAMQVVYGTGIILFCICRLNPLMPVERGDSVVFQQAKSRRSS